MLYTLIRGIGAKALTLGRMRIVYLAALQRFGAAPILTCRRRGSNAPAAAQYIFITLYISALFRSFGKALFVLEVYLTYYIRVHRKVVWSWMSESEKAVSRKSKGTAAFAPMIFMFF